MEQAGSAAMSTAASTRFALSQEQIVLGVTALLAAAFALASVVGSVALMVAIDGAVSLVLLAWVIA